MNASPNEVTLILDAINDVRKEVKDVKADVTGVRSDVSAMDKRINGRIRKLEAFRWQLIGMALLATVGLNVALRFI
jgi:hypothetical protein